MYLFYITKNTVIKSSVEQRNNVEHKIPLSQGTTLAIDSYTKTNKHYKVLGSWYLYEDHVKIYKEVDGEIERGRDKLHVPYYSQRDNKTRPHQTCNMTCCAMVIKAFYPEVTSKYDQLEDELTEWCVNNFGHEGIYYHSNLVKVLDHWGVRSTFSTSNSFHMAKKYLDEGGLCIYSGKFTRSGHIIVLVDYDDKGFYVHDPWGEYFSTGYVNKSGERLHYSYNLIGRVSYGNSTNGWIHLCTKK